MLIIHPKDRSTEFLKLIYNPDEDKVVDQSTRNSQLEKILNHTQVHERIIMLGHGSENGLFSKEDETAQEFDRLIISHKHTYYLRRHGGNLVGIWCNADAFAREEGLHGLFSGMIISEMEEAEEYGITTTPEELETENRKLASALGTLLNDGTPLHQIPEIMRNHENIHNQLTTFNYSNFHHL